MIRTSKNFSNVDVQGVPPKNMAVAFLLISHIKLYIYRSTRPVLKSTEIQFFKTVSTFEFWPHTPGETSLIWTSQRDLLCGPQTIGWLVKFRGRILESFFYINMSYIKTSTSVNITVRSFIWNNVDMCLSELYYSY